MLSRSIYNLNRTLEREFADGKGVSEGLHKSLIDVMSHWHKMALDMELELEDYHASQDQMAAGEVVSLTQSNNQKARLLRLVVDNTCADEIGDQS